MRVLLVNSEKGLRGGELQTLALGSGLAARDCDVMLAAAGGSSIAEAAAGKMSLRTYGFESIPLVTPPALARLIGEWKPDVIHAQTSRAHTHAWIARGLVSNAPPLVVSRRVAFRLSGGLLGRLKYRTGVAHYLPISRAAAATLIRAGVPDDLMTVVPSGIDTARFSRESGDSEWLDRWGIGRENFIVGAVGSFTPEKGHGTLIDAAVRVFESHPECRFVLIGKGRMERELQRRSMGVGEGRIVLAPPGAPLEGILPLFDLFVLPSLEEGLSTALLAAMAAGLPVVATRTGGIPEVVSGESGLLVPPGDAEALAGAIETIIEDDSMREGIAMAASERVHDFDIGITIERTLQVYSRIVEERTTGGVDR